MAEQIDRLGVEAVVAGISQYVSDANRFDSSTRKMGGSVDSVGRSFKFSAGDAIKFGAAVAGVDLTLRAASRGLTSFVSNTVGAAIAAESSFAGIRKTFDATEAEYERLFQLNRDLAKEIPVSLNEINRIGELGGQLGIRGVENLQEFEKTIAAISVTTNLTAEEAALSFAQIANVLQIPQDEIDNLGAGVVGLGNNFATTESKIVSFTQNIAGAGAVAKLSAGDVLGIATAFSSVGAEAEAGGTAVQKVLLAMQSAVINGGDELEIFARTTGQTTEEFARGFREDAGRELNNFVRGLAVLGEDGVRVLQDLGLEDQRLVRSFLSVVNAGDLLERAMAQGNEEVAKGTALTEEANKRYETAESRLQILQNRLKDVALQGGLAALEGISPLIDELNEFLALHGDEAAEALADAFERGIDLASDMADEVGKLVDLIRDLKSIGVVDLAFDLAMTQADKILLVLAAATAGFLAFGPGGALVIGGVTLGSLTVASVFANIGAGGIGPGVSRGTGDQGRFGPQITDANELIKAASAQMGVDAYDLGRELVEQGIIEAFQPNGPGSTSLRFAAGGMNRFAELYPQAAQALGVGPSFNVPLPGDWWFDEEAGIWRHPNDTGQSFDVPLPPGGLGSGGPDATYSPPGSSASNREAERARREALREAEGIIRDFLRAQEEARRAEIDNLNLLGDLITDALRDQAEEQLRLTEDSLDERRDAYEDFYEDRIDQIERERDAQVAALNAERDARLAAIDAQIDALDAERSAERRAELQRQLSLAYDPEERARIEADLREEDRRDLEDQLRDQQQLIRDDYDRRIDAAEAAADERVRIAKAEREAEMAEIDRLEAEARATYEAQTDSFALESEARRLIAEGEFEAIEALLASQPETWRTAGMSMGEALKDGIRQSLGNFIATTLAGAGVGPAAGNPNQEQIDNLNAIGKANELRGTPAFVQQSTRDKIVALGGVPEFERGLKQGMVTRRMLAYLDPNEVVLNPEQIGGFFDMAEGGTTFGPEAFRGMFEGASFNGTPRDNMLAAREVFQQMIDDQLTRGARRYGG